MYANPRNRFLISAPVPHSRKSGKEAKGRPTSTKVCQATGATICSGAAVNLSRLNRMLVSAAFLLGVAGCSVSPLRHLEGIPASVHRLAPGQENRTRASDDVEEAAADGWFVGVALSGGGSRSAVFSGEVLTRLHELGVMQRVDFVSGISAGSLAGAYYCLSHDPEEAGPDDLPWRRDVVEDLMRRGVWLDYFSRYVFNPINLIRYYGTGLNRSYQMRRVLDLKFFHNKTLAELNPKRPRLLVTATTLETGAVFTFTDRELARRGIQSGVLQVSDAVQASSSFPGLFHPYVLPDFTQNTHRPTDTRFAHLVDGGVYDNLGVVPLLKVYQQHRDRFPRGGVIIVADASLPAELKERLALHADTRKATDYVIDFGSMRKSIEIMFEVDRLGLMRALQEDSWHLGLKVIHLHYTTGLLSGDRDLHDELPNILDLDQPVPTNVDFGDKRHLVAPTSLGISPEHARATRDAARRVIDFNLDGLHRIRTGP